jgi:hypothetical protein
MFTGASVQQIQSHAEAFTRTGPHFERVVRGESHNTVVQLVTGEAFKRDVSTLP